MKLDLKCKYLFVSLLLLFFISCYSYKSAQLIKRIPLTEKEKEYSVRSFKRFTLDDIKSFKRNRYKKIYVKKKYAKLLALSPISKINNRAVFLAVKEKYIEAEILWLEVIKENKNEAAAYNNLGIIYEITGSEQKAHDMYKKACEISPKNKEFKNNFELYKKYN